MEISHNVEDDILVLSLAGDFDTTEVDYFAAEIATAIDAGHFRLVLDMLDLGFVNSTALGALIRAQKQIAQYGGAIAACRAPVTVEKTFKLLELQRRIPLHATLEESKKWLAEQGPESVSGTGEAVEFLVLGAESSFGTRARRGRIEEIREDGISIAFENLDNLEIEAAFAAGAIVKLSFLIPLYHPTHVFDVEGAITGHELLGRETVIIRTDFTEISDAELEAVKQYVKDLRFLNDES
jgi:anti-anti-sigma factor